MQQKGKTWEASRLKEPIRQIEGKVDMEDSPELGEIAVSQKSQEMPMGLCPALASSHSPV